MSESNDYDPGPWRGHDFGAARKTYDNHVGRSYVDATASGKTKQDLIPDSISSQTSAQLIIVCDVTGSMGDWPATIFSKLPYLDIEGKEYLGKDLEFCFAATGDAYTDTYPVQVRPFSSGLQSKDRLKELIIEGHGGGQMMETYEQVALYMRDKATMPNAIRKPILIFIGDEATYDFVNEDQAEKLIDIKLSKRLTTKELFRQLRETYSVYHIHKPYESSGRGDGMDANNRQIYAKWAELVGEDHIAILPQADRVVDVIFGILAQETDRVGYFRGEIEGRQRPDQVKAVYKSLLTIHELPPDAGKKPLGHSIMRGMTDGKPVKKLTP